MSGFAYALPDLQAGFKMLKRTLKQSLITTLVIFALLIMRIGDIDTVLFLTFAGFIASFNYFIIFGRKKNNE
jgi:hypothetical protein